MYNDVDTMKLEDIRWTLRNARSQRSRGRRRSSFCCRCATDGVGTAEIDLIHALRHNPGCTQAALAEILHADKAAIARRTKNLESKGLSRAAGRPERPPKPAFVSHRKGGGDEGLQGADRIVVLRIPIAGVLTREEAKTFAALLDRLYIAPPRPRAARALRI